MSGHDLEIRANVNGRGASVFLIMGGAQFASRAREALVSRRALTLPVIRPEDLRGPARALAVTRGGSTTIGFPADSIRDVRTV